MEFGVVLYHGIDDPSHPYAGRGDAELEWVIDARTFDRHMAIVRGLGFRVTTLPALLFGPPPPAGDRPLILSFDDGHVTNYQHAFPILARYGFPGEFFVTSDWMGTPNYMSPAQLRELVAAGSSVQAHGASHRFLSELDDENLRAELAGPRAAIGDAIGSEVTGLAYPGGRFDARVEAMAKELGYRSTCTSLRGWNAVGDGAFTLRRLGVNRGTTDAEFRAMLTKDEGFYRRRRWRNALASVTRRVAGRFSASTGA